MDVIRLKHTKRKLALIFSGSLMLLFFLAGSLFFTVKYISALKSDERDFSFFVEKLTLGDIPLKDAIGEADLENPDPYVTPDGFINAVLLDENNDIIQTKVRDSIDYEVIEEAIEEHMFLETQKEEGVLIQKLSLEDQNQTLILYRPLKYPFCYYIQDIGIFLLLSIILAFGIYFSSRRFITRVFQPIEENIEDMNSFVHSAGHELKTPLSIIDSNAQMIQSGSKINPDMIHEIRNETANLNSLIDSLMQLSDIDIFHETQELSVGNIVSEILGNMSQEIQKRKIQIQTELPRDYIVIAHRDYLYMYLSNLIGNAIKYNKTGGSIHIYLKDKTLCIQDTGVGIPEKDIEKIFNKFFQCDSSHSKSGFGIGLSLVHRIGKVYNWQIDISSEEGKGTTVEVVFI